MVYNIYRDTTSGFTPGPGNLLESCVTNTFFDDTSVSGGTTYYYVVRAEDATVGNGGPCRDGNTDPADGSLSDLPRLATPPPEILLSLRRPSSSHRPGTPPCPQRGRTLPLYSPFLSLRDPTPSAPPTDNH